MTSESCGAVSQQSEKSLHRRTGSERVTSRREHSAKPAIITTETYYCMPPAVSSFKLAVLHSSVPASIRSPSHRGKEAELA